MIMCNTSDQGQHIGSIWPQALMDGQDTFLAQLSKQQKASSSFLIVQTGLHITPPITGIQVTIQVQLHVGMATISHPATKALPEKGHPLPRSDR